MTESWHVKPYLPPCRCRVVGALVELMASLALAVEFTPSLVDNQINTGLFYYD